MSELTIKDKRKLPTKLLVDTYKEVGSYRGAARKLGVSVQFLHKRIKKHGGKDITTKEFINYHAMTREQLEAYIDSAITEAQQERIKRNKSFCGCPMCTHHSEPYEAQLKNNTTKQEDK